MPLTRQQLLGRYREMIQVLTRYGFGQILGRRGPDGDAVARGRRLRLALQELGPTFIKLGQLLSLRSDLLPPDVVAELERLQDQVEAFPYARVHAMVAGELGPPEQHFRYFSEAPVAAASLGQVHYAVRLDGRPVAVKVQRPGIAEHVELDLAALQVLARLLGRTPFGRIYDFPAVLREFGETIRQELDYEQEGANAERFAAAFAGDSTCRFPAVHRDLTTRRVLTLEWLEGIRVTDVAALREAGIDRRKLAQTFADAIFRMVLRDGFFHADPHPGNLLVDRDGTLLFLDLGQIGELSPSMRENAVEYVVGVVTHDSHRVVEAILAMGALGRPELLPQLRRDADRIQRKYAEVPLRQVEFGPALREVLRMAFKYQITFPTGYALLLKTLLTLEATVRTLDPDANLVGLAAPYATEIVKERLNPERLLKEGVRQGLDAGRHLLRLPRQVSRLLALAEDGHLRFGIDHAGLEPALRRLGAIANRVSLSILLASLIIGTALVAGSSQLPLAEYGFWAIGILSLVLALSLARSLQR